MSVLPVLYDETTKEYLLRQLEDCEDALEKELVSSELILQEWVRVRQKDEHMGRRGKKILAGGTSWAKTQRFQKP